MHDIFQSLWKRNSIKCKLKLLHALWVIMIAYNHMSSLVLRMNDFKPLQHEMGSWIEKHRAHLDTCYWEIVSVQRKGG